VTGTAAQLLARASALGEVSEEPHRLTRRFATPALARAGELVAGWMEEAGMTVRRDAVGNVVGELAWPGADGPALVIGSHLDTVPDAGRFDGPLGVLTGIAVVERVTAEGEAPSTPVQVVGFADEEGARFGIPYLGSAAFTGRFDPAWLDLPDADGITVLEAIRAAGGDAAEVMSTSERRPAGYLEVHIEQGPVLEELGLPVGVVSAIAGQTRATLTLRGRAGHAGTVPMSARQDALAAAAEVVLAVERLAREGDGLVATVGALSVEPGASNVIPGEARLSLDVRHGADFVRAQVVATMRETAERIAAGRGVELEWVTLVENEAVEMSPDLMDRLAAAIAAEGHAVHSLVSGAGHDAVVLARVCPAAMLFVRCAGGISHDPHESVAEEDVAVALDVLERVVRGLSQGTRPVSGW
jgi:hydantoinase/carbamoylase family amidase